MNNNNQEKKSPFDNDSFAFLYEKRNRAFGYPGELLHFVKDYLTKSDVSTVADIGAGTGAFSIPLSLAGFTIYAVEPAHGMRAVFEEKIKDSSLPITIYSCTLEQLPALQADSCIAMHSVYGMALDAAISKMLSIAPLVLIAVRTELTYTLSDCIRKYFKKERSKHFSENIQAFCNMQSIPYTKYTLHQKHIIHIPDVYEEALFHCRAMGLDTDFIPQIETIIKDNCRQNDSYWFENIHDDEVFILHKRR